MSTFGNMYTGTGVQPGQLEYVPAGGGSYTWTVPEGVTSISAVVVGAPWADGTTPTHSTIRRGSTTLLSSGSTLGSGIGGGNGGEGGPGVVRSTKLPDEPGSWDIYEHLYFAGGGGGAGGYSGDGGWGGHAKINNSAAVIGGNGAGGGGAGGIGTDVNDYGPGRYDYGSSGGYDGGGVGLRGQGANGTSGWVSNTRGSYLTSGQPVVGGAPSGSSASSISTGGSYLVSAKVASAKGRNGGNLRWKNDIPVTPGEKLTLYAGQGGGLRVMWGGGRSYPSNAGNL